MFSPKQHDMSIVGFTLRDNVFCMNLLESVKSMNYLRVLLGSGSLWCIFFLVISMVPSSTKFGLVSISIDASSWALAPTILTTSSLFSVWDLYGEWHRRNAWIGSGSKLADRSALSNAVRQRRHGCDVIMLKDPKKRLSPVGPQEDIKPCGLPPPVICGLHRGRETFGDIKRPSGWGRLRAC